MRQSTECHNKINENNNSGLTDCTAQTETRHNHYKTSAIRRKDELQSDVNTCTIMIKLYQITHVRKPVFVLDVTNRCRL